MGSVRSLSTVDNIAGALCEMCVRCLESIIRSFSIQRG